MSPAARHRLRTCCRTMCCLPEAALQESRACSLWGARLGTTCRCATLLHRRRGSQSLSRRTSIEFRTIDEDAGSARRKLFIGHIREVERFAAVRERDPGIAQACKVLALVIIVRFLGQSRHSSGRFPSGVALLHVVGSVLASRKTYYTAVGSRRTQLLLNVNRGINSARSSTCRTGRAPIASHPWAGLGVAAEPPSAGRVNASCEGQRRCASSLCQRGNISAHSRRRLGEAILCRPCSESYVSHVAAPPARERAYIAMCIEDKRNRQLRS